MDRFYSSFIKFGNQEFMEKLFYEGEIFCKPIDYFTTIDNKDYRGDKNDGIAYIKQIRNLKISHKGKLLATSENGQLYGRDPEDKGNIYCLFGLRSKSLNWETKETQKLVLNLDCLNFGDTAIWIFNPEEFIERVKKAVIKKGFHIQISPIKYIDYKTYDGNLSPFTKSKEYEGQSEIRFWIPNKVKKDLKFNIGDISDISGIVTPDKFDKLEYEIE